MNIFHEWTCQIPGSPIKSSENWETAATEWLFIRERYWAQVQAFSGLPHCRIPPFYLPPSFLFVTLLQGQLLTRSVKSIDVHLLMGWKKLSWHFEIDIGVGYFIKIEDEKKNKKNRCIQVMEGAMEGVAKDDLELLLRFGKLTLGIYVALKVYNIDGFTLGSPPIKVCKRSQCAALKVETSQLPSSLSCEANLNWLWEDNYKTSTTVLINPNVSRYVHIVSYYLLLPRILFSTIAQ